VAAPTACVIASVLSATALGDALADAARPRRGE
jgi:ABC-type dipeptide/oligopeptide/nickel transport system permease subunit